MKKNNLFMYATSELSQDAFICWLLNFAHKDHLSEDAVLKDCAKELLSKIVQTGEDLIVTDIFRQYKNIDVYIQVNDKYNIIIEDKTFTGQHGDQINHYKRSLEDEGKKNIICVYYKIVEQPFEEDTDVNINRQGLMEVFSKYADKTQNNIFKDYYEYLLSIDKDVNAFSYAPIDIWRKDYNHIYKGFFTHLIKNAIVQTVENDIIKGGYGWGYVPNFAGGFWGLWWFNFKREKLTACNIENYIDELYLQIEDNKIALKMIGNSDRSTDVRWSLYNYLKSKTSDFKKRTFRRGEYMTIGYIEYTADNYAERIKLMQDIMQSIANGEYTFEYE